MAQYFHPCARQPRHTARPARLHEYCCACAGRVQGVRDDDKDVACAQGEAIELASVTTDDKVEDAPLVEEEAASKKDDSVMPTMGTADVDEENEKATKESLATLV